jgi:hypothetical protein
MPSSVINSDDGVISGTSGLKSVGGDDGNLVFQSKGTETARINTDKQIVAAAGTASLPALTTTGDVNTGIFFPAADTIAFAEGGVEAMRIDSAGNVGIGTTSPSSTIGGGGFVSLGTGTNQGSNRFTNGYFGNGTTGAILGYDTGGGAVIGSFGVDKPIQFITFSGAAYTERARITSGGVFMVGKTVAGVGTNGAEINDNGNGGFSRNNGAPLACNRTGNDGQLVTFFQDTIEEGNISVSGSTVSYNGGHLSRWAQMLTKPDLLKGTVMSNLDEMNVYVDADGNPVENEQLNKVKVSDVEGDANVAGVFVNWDYDEAHQVDEINMAMTGDMIIRISEGVTVARGDLLMSAGDGTAKPQGDDIVRSKTIAKVTSTHVTCTYDDGSYCVPCVLMAC